MNITAAITAVIAVMAANQSGGVTDGAGMGRFLVRNSPSGSKGLLDTDEEDDGDDDGDGDTNSTICG
ncbi:hypothetical protein N7478_005249 [Penicillium angulare]|uniref:uncharacterized protein n=1 Tax=Penicillium angulare TaxID=116970 RepID=UPI0025406A4C|nr:uncharacterized protein N7478_005249 [Penicillium angulare]KAJ5279877.1 hypothetical protein N7478_005249 [Penicillium angulare]